MRALYLLLLVLASLGSCTNAARMPQDPLTFSLPRGNLQPWMHAANRAAAADDEPAYVAFYYMVDPGERQNFMDAWLHLESLAAKETGLCFFDLKHPRTDNVLFVGYGEWKSMRHFMKHYESGYVQDFISRLNKMDVEYHLVMLERPDVAELNPRRREEHRGHMAHVMIHYHVPPSAQEGFLEAWDRAEKCIEGEKGAHVYSLRKFMGSNHHYFAYGTWASREDFHKHLESDHIQELLAGLNKHGVEWHMAPLVKIGNQKE